MRTCVPTALVRTCDCSARSFRSMSMYVHEPLSVSLAERSWRPVLEGPEARMALALAEQIADQLPATTSDLFWPLVDGYLARELNSERHAVRALTRVQALLDEERLFGSPGLYLGFSGVGFVVEHLSSLLADWVERSDVDPCAEID